ncbi:MAG: glycosyltransferase family 4 protein [Desulfobacterales bacterium]
MVPNHSIRVAVIIPKYGLVGGAETYVFELCERLALRGEFQIHVLANKWRKGKAPITFHKIPIISFPRFLQPLSFAYFAKKHIHLSDYSLVHSHDRIFGMDLLTFHGIPHETWIRNIRRRHLTLFDRATAWVEQKGFKNQRLKIVMPVSGLVQEEVVKRYGFLKDKILMNPPGVDLERFSILDPLKCRQEILLQYGWSQKDIIVLFVSMNFKLKRLDLVLKSMAFVAGKERENSNLKLLVVGKGDEKRFKKLARDMGISKQVIFAGVTREVEKYYMAADIFAMPSSFDTFGLVVLEAMAAGLPVIISKSVGARDLVKEGLNGFILSEEPSVSEMGTSLSLLLDSGKRKLMGENGRRVARLHTWDKTADRVADLYRRLVNGTDCSL